MTRTMLNENGLPKYFWTEAVNTTCYVVNRAHIHSILKRTLYELWKGRLLPYHIFILLAINVLSTTMERRPQKNLMLNLMKVFSLVIHQLARHIESLTKNLRRLKSRFMLFFMRLTVLCLVWMMMMLTQGLKKNKRFVYQ